MTREASEVLQMFFDKVEEDCDFFAYFGVSDEEALALAKERAQVYLREAVSYLRSHAELDFDLDVVAEPVEEADGTVLETNYYFAEEINFDEAELLAEIMFLRYLERGLAKLKPKINVLSSTDLKTLHSPANERTSYVSMINSEREHVYTLMSHYVAKDRVTGKRKVMSKYGTFYAEADE